MGREPPGGVMTDKERDELLERIADDVSVTKRLLYVLACSHRDLLAKLESPIMDKMREDLETK